MSAWAANWPQTFPAAREVFDEVDAALGQKLSKLMWDGPKDELTLTENAQPALMAVSMAVMRVLEREKGFSLKDRVKFVAGHSLGEYSALAAAGAFTLTDTAKLLKLRGKAMQAAVPVGQGAMAALLGVGLDVARQGCAKPPPKATSARSPTTTSRRRSCCRATSRRWIACRKSASRWASAAPCRCRSPRPSIAR